jgi:hypothetical protein
MGSFACNISRAGVEAPRAMRGVAISFFGTRGAEGDVFYVLQIAIPMPEGKEVLEAIKTYKIDLVYAIAKLWNQPRAFFDCPFHGITVEITKQGDCDPLMFAFHLDFAVICYPRADASDRDTSLGMFLVALEDAEGDVLNDVFEYKSSTSAPFSDNMRALALGRSLRLIHKKIKQPVLQVELGAGRPQADFFWPLGTHHGWLGTAGCCAGRTVFKFAKCPGDESDANCIRLNDLIIITLEFPAVLKTLRASPGVCASRLEGSVPSFQSRVHSALHHCTCTCAAQPHIPPRNHTSPKTTHSPHILPALEEIFLS